MLVGYTVRSLVHQTVEENLRSELTTLLRIERSMIEKWLKVQESSAVALANDEQIRKAALQLLAATADTSRNSDVTAAKVREQEFSNLHAQFESELEPGLWSQGFVGFDLFDKQQRIVGAYTQELIGRQMPEIDSVLTRTFEGKPTVSAPFPSERMLMDKMGTMRSGTPTMFVCAPVRDDNDHVVAVLALRIPPEKEFTEILRLGRLGETGETYAVNRDGLMVSNSRFDKSLVSSGLLPSEGSAASILRVQVRDPGGNMLQGFRPSGRLREMPLTKACAAALNGNSGFDLDGYRDYRGVPVVGAWTWLPEYEVAILTEMEAAEAYRPLTILKWSFYSLYVLLGVSAIAIFVFTVVIVRLHRQAQKAEIEAKQLGQYRLLEKIGVGAMGVVYKGEHAMLRRPTAIKLLDVDCVNEASIRRFEREVQITCSLNSPHTVAIYDYGRTPEGVFYYAMEYLDGLDLQTLVDQYGPQTEGRVVAILRQICSSLEEAHALGLVHRDIKPANIMLNRRAAQPDVVKVLDFGLVKALNNEERGNHLGGDLSGTPLYMSPEAIQMPEAVDAGSDLYAVGAVGYFLLTGQTVFTAQTLPELCQQHISVTPDAPSQRLGRTVSAELEHAILACLEKSRGKRPKTARDLAAMLDQVAQTWSFDDAERWWSHHECRQNATNACTARAGRE